MLVLARLFIWVHDMDAARPNCLTAVGQGGDAGYRMMENNVQVDGRFS